MSARTTAASRQSSVTAGLDEDLVLREPSHSGSSDTGADSLEIPPSGAVTQNSSSSVGRVLVLPITSWSPSYKFEILQEWEGSVLEVSEETILVRLIDKTNPSTEEVLSELNFDELSDDDRSRVREGSVFSWYIGYLTERGTRFRVSQVRFRRLPAMTAGDIQRAQAEAREVLSDLGWD